MEATSRYDRQPQPTCDIQPGPRTQRTGWALYQLSSDFTVR